MARAGLLRSPTIVGAVVWLVGTRPALASAGPLPVAGPIQPVGTIHAIELPGGVEGIRRAIGDRRPTPPATIAIEMARRFHGGTSDAAGDDPVLAGLRAWLRTCAGQDGCEAAGLAPDRVPLPGAPAVWRDVVFQGRVPEAQLMLAILDRRDAALLVQRAHVDARGGARVILARPALVRQLCGADAGPPLVAAPYLRSTAIAGSCPAAPPPRRSGWPWRASRPTRPSRCCWRCCGSGRSPAYMLGGRRHVDDAQQRACCRSRMPRPPARRWPGAARRLASSSRAAGDLRERPFGGRRSIRVLLGQLRVGADDLLLLRRPPVLDAVFADGAVVPRDAAARSASGRPVAGLGGMARVADLDRGAGQRADPLRADPVRVTAAGAADASQAAAVATIPRGYARHPQLLRVLDRLGVDDVGRLVALVHRADGLARSAADWRGHAAVVRWQSALVFLDHMTRLDAVDRDELHRALDALAAPDQASASRGTRVRALLAASVSGRSPAIRRLVPSRTRWWRG